MSWLDQTISSIATRTGLDAASFTPDPDTRRALLDVARVASHTSGDRINAPLLCYVLGMMVQQGATLADAIAVVKEAAGEGSEDA
jgi:hypothetical protein